MFARRAASGEIAPAGPAAFDAVAARGRLTSMVLATAAVAVGVPLLVESFSDYYVTLCIQATITAIALLSVGIVTDRAGLLSVCPLSFAAIGAWAVGLFNEHGWPGGFFLWLVLGGVAAMPFGLLVGLPALRLRGINLAVITLSFAVALDSVLNHTQFPGTETAQFVARPGAVVSDNSYFVLCWGIFFFFALVVWALGRLPFGSAWRALARSERATAAMGRSVSRTKLGVFVLSAFVAGISGALIVGQVGTAVADNFSSSSSLLLFAVAILVGAGYPEGALVGGLFSAFFPAILTDVGLPQDLGNILFAVGAFQVLSVGTSMTGGWRRSARRLQRRRRARGRPYADRVPIPPAHDVEIPPTDGSAVALTLAQPATQALSPDRPRRPANGERSGTPVLATRGLTVRYANVIALEDISIEIAPQSVSGLIGPNGAGKSTFVDAVTGFVTGYQGSIELDGSPIDSLPVHRRVRAGLRRTFQQERTVPALTIAAYVRLAARRRITREEIASILDFLAAPPADEPIAEIDVGSRRLVELAGCLAARPRVLLLDEPTAGLAQAESIAVGGRIAEIPERYGCAVLLIEHDMEVVTVACEHVTVLDFGREIAKGTPKEVLEHAAVVSAYLGDQAVVV
jgi:branched-chain amino acid transport system permease protein